MLRADDVTVPVARPAGTTWRDHVVLAVVLGVLLTGFGTVVEGRDWWVTAALVTATVGVTCALGRAVGLRLVTPLATLVGLVTVSWVFVPGTLLVGLPTPATVSALGGLLGDAWTIVLEEQAPVAAARPVVLVVSGALAIVVLVADAVLVRRWGVHVVGVLLLAVHVTPATISGSTPSAWLFVVAAAGWLVLLRSRSATGGARGWGRRLPALGLGVAAVGASVVFPSVAPDVSAVAASWGKPPPAVFGRGINPMVELGQNLRRSSPQVALTYRTTLDSAPYLKVATLRAFSGRTWSPAVSTSMDPFEGTETLDPDVARSTDRTSISIQGLDSPMLPVPYVATGVDGLEGSWRFEPLGMTVRSRDATTRGQTYAVRSVSAEPTAQQMRGFTTRIGTRLAPYVQLPRDLPRVIETTARDVTAGAANDYDRALALQAYLRDGDFRYSETAPVADDYEGNGVDVIAEFLERKAGYCVHFSSTMAVMARVVGIPSRIAVGYAPGESIGVRDGETVYENTSDDLHAWTELYFEGAGWVRFDPTTGIGSATRFEEPATDTPGDTGGDAAAPTAPERTETPRGADTVTPEVVDTTSATPRTLAVTGAVVLVVAASPALVRIARRRWRARRDDVDAGWRELVDTARDLGLETSAADTPRGLAARLRARPGTDTDALDRLLAAVEQARFARPGRPVPPVRPDLAAVVGSLRAASPWSSRVRATLLPPSLVPEAALPRVVAADRSQPTDA